MPQQSPRMDELTLRDLYALFALTGLLTGRPASVYDPGAWAIEAYSIADAMLAERKE